MLLESSSASLLSEVIFSLYVPVYARWSTLLRRNTQERQQVS